MQCYGGTDLLLFVDGSKTFASKNCRFGYEQEFLSNSQHKLSYSEFNACRFFKRNLSLVPDDLFKFYNLCVNIRKLFRREQSGGGEARQQ